LEEHIDFNLLTIITFKNDCCDCFEDSMIEFYNDTKYKISDLDIITYNHSYLKVYNIKLIEMHVF